MKPVNAFAGLLLVIGMGLSGCFPDSQESGNLSMQFSLTDMGFSPSEDDLHAWTDYLGKLEQGLVDRFELGRDGANFYLGLRLACQEADVSIQGLGSIVEVSTDGEGNESLEMNMNVSTCTDGVFSVAVFWREGEVVNTFTGTSEPADLPPIDQSPLEVDVFLHPVGKLSCDYDSSLKQGPLTFSGIDYLENVLFTSVQVPSDGQTVSFTLDQVPVGRLIQIDVDDSAGVNEMLTETALVTQAGQTVTEACQP